MGGIKGKSKGIVVPNRLVEIAGGFSLAGISYEILKGLIFFGTIKEDLFYKGDLVFP